MRQCDAAEKPLLLAACRLKIFLSPLLPVSILIDSLLPSKLGLPLVVLHFVILRFSLLPFSDSRDPTLISDFNGCSRFWFWAAHLVMVSSAITAGSPCGCSAAYSPSAYLTLPKHLFSFLFTFSAFFFLSIGRLRADRCLPGGIGAPWGMPFRWVVLFSVFFIQCLHCVRKSSSSISLRNAIKKSNSFSRHLSFLFFKSLISYLVAGGSASEA